MILVTGANGFLGKKVVACLTAKKRDVVQLHRGSSLMVGEDRWEADLTNRDHVRALMQSPRTPHTIIHLAGRIEISLRSDPRSPLMPPLPGTEDIHATYLVNIIATANMLEYGLHKGVKHIIYASSQAVYGLPADRILTERSACLPLEHYAASKLCGEQILQVGARQGIVATALRFPGLYSDDRPNGVVYNFCMSALRTGQITVTADLPLPLDVIHVDDVTDAIERSVRCTEEQWSCLNIATGEPCSLDLLADSVAELVPGCTVKHAAIPQPVVCMDASKAGTLLGWRALPRRERLSHMINKLRTTI